MLTPIEPDHVNRRRPIQLTELENSRAVHLSFGGRQDYFSLGDGAVLLHYEPKGAWYLQKESPDDPVTTDVIRACWAGEEGAMETYRARHEQYRERIDAAKHRLEDGDTFQLRTWTFHVRVPVAPDFDGELSSTQQDEHDAVDDISRMRETYFQRDDVTYDDLANRYDLSRSTVGSIIRGESHDESGGPIKGDDYE